MGFSLVKGLLVPKEAKLLDNFQYPVSRNGNNG